MPQVSPVPAANYDYPPPDDPGRREDASSSPKKLTSHKVSISWSWFFVTVPITALTIAFLVMVFRYRVIPNDSPFDNLRFASTNDDKHVVYVDLNSSFILFVASWASSLAPMLSGFLMALASFPIARQLSNNIRDGRADSLPTPYQLGLTLKFIDGSALGAMWSWFMYLVTWKKTRQPQTPILVTASNIAILATVLGLLVSAADTWLHLTATTVPFTDVSAIADPIDYSFGLVPDCLKSNNSIAAQRQSADDYYCSIATATTGSFFRNSTITFQVISNLSSEATVYTHTDSHGKPYAYFGIPSDSLTIEDDFTAHTYGAHTSCSLMTQPCHVRAVVSSIRFNCSAAFAGFIDDPSVQSTFFTNEKMQEATTLANEGTKNPYYFGLASLETTGLQPEVPGGPTNKDFAASQHGATTFVLGCKSTIYDIEYDRVNGSITRFDTKPSNTSVSNIWQATIANYPSDWDLPVKQAMTAAFVSTNTSQEFADLTALSYSKASMAFGAQGIERRPSLALQRRSTKLVARIPIAPLVALVAFSLLFVITGLLFTGLAIWAARFEEVRHIQANLGIVGLVADRFEKDTLKREAKGSDGFFAENVGKTGRRVAIEKYSEMDTYRYTTWQSTGASKSG